MNEGLIAADIRGEIAGLLAAHKNWLILAHEKPDGDTLGSVAALASLGLRLGKRVVLGGGDVVPSHYDFLTAELPYEVFSEVPFDRLDDDALLICIDTSTVERSVRGLREAAGRYTVVNIDHHADNERFGSVNWVDRDASATGEMITELMARSPWGITPSEAKALYVAIASDNGGFRFASTSVRSHECAIELIRAGASPDVAARELESNLTADGLRLWSRALARTEVFAEGKGALFWLANEDFEATGCSRAATENLVNFLLRIKGVMLAALLCEAGEIVRVSLRAVGPMNARTVAQRFGGGGHDLAAGCRAEGGVSSLLPELRRIMEEHIADRYSAAR